MFSRYYQSELAYLRDMGREFGLRHPGLAEALTERGTDPDVERLLEGFAFLAARIRERTEAAVPELAEPLAELIAPHTLRGIPAATILELEPRAGALRARHEIKAGAIYGSRAVQGAACPFQTRADVALTPARIEVCRLDEMRADAPEIVARIRVPEAARDSVLGPAPLRLFLHGTHALATTLLLWIARHLDQVSVRLAPGDEIHLGASAARLPALDGTIGDLWPWPETAPVGPRLAAEYFTFPEKFFFVDVHGLERVPAARARETLELSFRFRKPPALPERLPTDALRLHCVPAINLFTTSAEPIRRAPLREELHLRAAGLAPHQAEVHTVDRVIGRRMRRGGEIHYGALSLFDHGRGGAHDAFFTLRRRRSPLDGGLDTYLLLGDDGAPDDGLVDETVSVEMTCTSRLLASELRAGDVGAPLPASPTLATARNVSRVSKPIPAALGTELQWRLLGYLASTHRSLASPDALRSLLSSFNVPELVDVHVERANSLRLEGIREVRAHAATRAHRGAVVRGVETRIELEESRFSGPGDAFLFGCALDRLLSAEVPINAFCALSVGLHASMKELTWTPRTGTQSIL
ncbi:type VI secretion system baseplate subunit TssF [Sandaracinus amylolyticus]|uniref:type VI secretion system baseplate subunit TssF n=1 Tax=Sandaracinus amylolyticus TaxID=927083 RepID=UPI001F22F702|nr:type VI secretion system baseplate subunit TssF [Sandaracinus amylolyticus]UJR78612.1 Type VI secretion system protein ImpG [Sandaracinus amylolyticus]